MSSIAWGSGSGADIELPFVGNSTVDALQIGDALFVDFATVSPASDTQFLLQFDGAVGAYNNGATLPAQGVSGNVFSAQVGTNAQLACVVDGQRQAIERTTLSTDFTETAINHTSGPALGMQSFGCRFFYKPGTATGIYQEAQAVSGGNSNWVVKGEGGNPGRIVVALGGSQWDSPYNLVAGQWADISFQYDYTNTRAGFWVNGVYIQGGTVSASGFISYPNTASQIFLMEGWANRENDYSIDTFELWTGDRYSSALPSNGIAPRTIYNPGGTAILSGIISPGNLIEVSWDVDVNSPYAGGVSAVYAFSSGAWVQVGGANPSSPITGLSLPMTAGEMVKIELAASGDTLQTQTPELLWVRVDYAPLSTGGIPFRYQGRTGPSMAGQR
jgi:hypothetical protein